MAQIVNVDTLVPWDLTLTIGGEKCLTVEPDVGELRELAILEKNLKGSQSSKMIQRIRIALKKFVHKDAHKAINAADFFTLESAMLVASAYFEAWQKKKRAAAIAEGLKAAGVPETEAKTEAEKRAEKMTQAALAAAGS